MDLILDARIFSIPMVSFIIGLLFCFLGRKLLGFIVIVFGFMIGFSWLSLLLADITGTTVAASPWVAWVSGLIGAALGLVAWKVSMLLAGAVIGLFVARGLLPSMSSIVHAAIALASGILMHVYKEPITALLTAIAGAYIAAGSAMIMLEDIGFVSSVAGFIDAADPGPVIALVLMFIFCLTGYKFQARSLGS
ncbi:MAG: hypothetical protein AVO35_01485 [Candidatus Aegiribacteria sp. MLS_C]|nr:MAG: hypothetical protein AVO35_01485 [Candidatus Aegiribacteria sp. MLS_C]